jgi:hypothetical protein
MISIVSPDPRNRCDYAVPTRLQVLQDLGGTETIYLLGVNEPHSRLSSFAAAHLFIMGGSEENIAQGPSPKHKDRTVVRA